MQTDFRKRKESMGPPRYGDTYGAYFDAAQEIFPDATEGELGYILWNETGYPHYFNAVGDETSLDCCIKQLENYRAELDAIKEATQ